jgi:hypothetical protein
MPLEGLELACRQRNILVLHTVIGDRSGRLRKSCVLYQSYWYHCLQELDRAKCSDERLMFRRHKDEFDARESLVLPCRDFLSVLTDFGMN